MDSTEPADNRTPPPLPPPGPVAPWAPAGYPPAGWGLAPGYPPPAYRPAPGYGAPPGWAPGWHPPAPIGFGRFRPQGVGEILDSAFSLYRSNLRLILMIAAVVEIPLGLLTLGMHAVLLEALHLRDLTPSAFVRTGPHGQLSPSGFAQDVATGQVVVVLGVTLALALLGALVVRPLGTAATARAVSDRYLDREAGVGAAYRAALGRLVTLAGVALLLVAAVAVPALVTLVIAVFLAAVISPLLLIVTLPLVLVAGVVPLVHLSLTSQIVMLEGTRAVASIRRSWRLVRGSFWRVLGYLVLLSLLSLIISLVLSALTGAIGGVLGGDKQLLFGDVTSALIAVFVAPLTYITLTLLYYDLRIRREAFDVEMLARAL